jgi:hypothetical protein
LKIGVKKIGIIPIWYTRRPQELDKNKANTEKGTKRRRTRYGRERGGGLGLVAYHEGITESNLGHLALVHLLFNGARSMNTKRNEKNKIK